MAPTPSTVWTIGHSTRPFDAFVTVLQTHGIEAIADVRRFPGSRRYPWFASETMAETLPAHDIAYLWLPQLGGRRKVQPGSTNSNWRNPSFQGYADHLASAEFADGLSRLLALAATRRTALMCAEAMWWQCHRALISDVLKVRGIEVLHIADTRPPAPHPYSAAARVQDGQLSYAPAQAALF